MLLGPRRDQVLNKTVSRDVDPRSLIKPVPGGVDPPSRSESQDTLDSEKPPQWIEVTMVSTLTHSLTHSLTHRLLKHTQTLLESALQQP